VFSFTLLLQIDVCLFPGFATQFSFAFNLQIDRHVDLGSNLFHDFPFTIDRCGTLHNSNITVVGMALNIRSNAPARFFADCFAGG
jgi:hypothetical protein